MIKLTEKEKEFLINLAHELETQDTRGTAQPYGLTITQENIRIVPDGFGDCTLYIINDYEFTDDEWDRFLKVAEGECEEEVLDKLKKLDGFDELLNNELADKFDIKIFECEKERIVPLNRFNFFLTEKAAKKYIEEDSHNLNKPKVFGVYLWKNNEMKNLIDLIIKIGNQLKDK